MIWPGAYRHQTSDSLRAVEACEQAAMGGSAAPAKFRKMGRLLLREDFLNGGYSHDLQQRTEAVVALATGKRREFWAYTRVFAGVRTVRSRAQAILLKNNVRSFYVAEHLSLKVSNPNEQASTHRVANEARARGRIRPTSSFTVPETTATGAADGNSYLLEALLEGYGAMANAGPAFAQQFVAFQRANAVSHGDGPGIAALAPALTDALADLQLKMPRRIAAHLSRLERKGVAAEPWALCNGDLSRSNIFLKDGAYAITDWEFAKDGPAALDAVRLATQFPAFSGHYIAAIGHPEAQTWLFLACLRSLLEHVARYRGLSGNPHDWAIRRKTARKVRELLALADMLGGQNNLPH